MTKKFATILSLLAVLLIAALITACGTSSAATAATRKAPVEYASAFIDFSGITEVFEFRPNQPPADSEYTKGAFTLPNGITGDGLRVSHRGDSNEVMVVRYNDEMAVQVENGDYLYFFIDNDIIKRAENVVIEFTFYDDMTGSFNLQYVRKGHDFYPIAIAKGGTKKFVTYKLELDACNFTKGHNQGAQFRFESGVIIQRIGLVTGGMEDPLSDPAPEFPPATALNNMIGKGVTGYQVWFSTSNWHHWRGGTNTGRPRPDYINVELWPSGMEDYLENGATLYDTDFSMPNGSVAQLFNSHDVAIIRTHMKWMRDSGIDGAAVQRFFGFASPVDTGNATSHLTTIRDASEEFGRIFYIMYDMSGAGIRENPDQDSVVKRIQLDWIYNIERKGLVSSPNYAQAEGKPVVCIWGVEANESTGNFRFISVDATIKLVHWFRDRGYYIIGGLPNNTFWQPSAETHRRGHEMHSLFDMISPWYIGRDVTGQILSGGQWLTKDMAFCKDNPRKWADNKPIDFMPTVWPGFGWTNMGNPGLPNSTPRNAGQWVWTQIQGYLNRDKDNVIQSIYFAMFDEYDEGTNWMKAGVDYFDIPLNQYFKTYSADGYWLSSDYYMRMARASVEALQKKIAAGGGTATSGAAGYTGPLNDYANQYSTVVEHSQGPVFWRNSFERRSGRFRPEGGRYITVDNQQIDVGVPGGGLIGSPQNVTVEGTFSVNRPAVRAFRPDRYTPPSETLGMIYTDNARSGRSVFRLAGEKTGSGAAYLYKIADTRIRVRQGMTVSFWQRAENSLGANVNVDLMLDNGSYLSAAAGYNLRNDGSPQNGWQRKIATLPAALEGRYITAVIVAYRDSGAATGNFAAQIDDIIIANN